MDRWIDDRKHEGIRGFYRGFGITAATYGIGSGVCLMPSNYIRHSSSPRTMALIISV
jgi:hypothetical protein